MGIGGDNCLKLKRYCNPGIFCSFENRGMLIVGGGVRCEVHS
jgi:hypothetical protein